MKEEAFQSRIDALDKTFSVYVADNKATQALLFAKLDLAAQERKEILIQTTRTNGRVNRLEGDKDEHAKRLVVLESEQRETMTFKGKAGVVVGIVLTIIAGVMMMMLKSLT